MQRFWSTLAVQLGKHAWWVCIVGVAVTVVLAAGIPRLTFATGQDSYLNKDDQEYKDNVVFQHDFGGQAMLTLVALDEGHKIDELFTKDGRDQFAAFHDALTQTGRYQGVITPLTVLDFSDALVQSPTGDITQSIAGKALLTATGKEPPGSPQAAARGDDNAKT